MALYFIRMVPCASTGFSPYQVVHGWEPTSPIHLLYEGWTDSELGKMDIAEWVRENYERVEEIRDRSLVRQIEIVEKRKVLLDGKSSVRVFDPGDKVLLRTPGRDNKLVDA